MVEESKILEKLVRRQVRFQDAISKGSEKVRLLKGVQLTLPGLKPTTQKIVKTKK